jgi:hypothetical protein
MQLSAVQAQQLVRLQRKTMHAWNPQHKNNHLILMGRLGIEIRDEETRLPATARLMIIDIQPPNATRQLRIEGSGDTARLRHAHRTCTRATTPLTTPARKGGALRRYCCQGDAGALVKVGATGAATVNPRWATRHRPAAPPLSYSPLAAACLS